MPSPCAPQPARILAKVKELSKAENGVKYMVNRNPRNLERLRIVYKPGGYHLKNPGRSFWHKLELTTNSQCVTAQIVHFKNGLVLQASTAEWAIRKNLCKPTYTSAYVNLAREYGYCKMCKMGIPEPSSTKRGRKCKADTSFLSKLTTWSDTVLVSVPLSQSSANVTNDVTESRRTLATVTESLSQSSVKDSNLSDAENFEMFKRTFSKWTVKIAKTDTLYESRCNCPAYLKEYLCKHIIGLGIRFKLI